MKPTGKKAPERIHIEQSAKRLRGYLGGDQVLDSARPRLVWENPSYPAYYFPIEDVRMDFLVPTTTVTHSAQRGDARHFTIKAGGTESPDGAWQYSDSPVSELRPLIRFDWRALDAWF